MNRNELAVKSSAVGITSQLINLLLKFAVRTCIIRFLGKEILGLDSVLIDAISMLSLAEMGITSAMLYRMYAPVVAHDTKRISVLMASYRRIYHILAVIVAVLGMVISLALPWIVKDITVSWPQIYLAFYLHLISSVSSYLLAYQRILLNADQKKHLCLLADLVANVVFSAIRILAIVLFKSYTIFLVAGIAQIITSNVILRLYSRKRYPYVDSKEKFDPEDTRAIIHDTKDLLGNKLAGYVYSSTDNLIISIFLGTTFVSLLSNYKYIATALRSLVNSAMSTIQPIIGNYLNSEVKKEEAFRVLQRYTFVRYVIAGATAVPLIVLSHLFVHIWTADDSYLLPTVIPILLAADYYIGCVYGPLGEYILGMGLFKQGKYATYAGAICNAVLSLVGVMVLGTEGVLLATVVGQLVIWAGDYYILFHGYFSDHHEFRGKYILRHLLYILLAAASCALSLWIFSFLVIPIPILKFVVGGIVTEAIFLLTVLLVFGRTDEFGYAKDLLRKVCTKLTKHKNKQT